MATSTTSVYMIDPDTGLVKWRAGDNGSGSAWFGTTPALTADDRLILVDSEIDGVTGVVGRLYGFDVETGSQKWQEVVTASGGDIQLPSDNAMVGVSGKALVSLSTPVMFDPETGSQVWEGPTPNCL